MIVKLQEDFMILDADIERRLTMEKFIDILAEIDKTREAIKAAVTKKDELIDKYIKICDLKERHEAKKTSEKEIIEASEKSKDLKITLKILKNNAKLALFNEVMPVALEVLSKYNNKPYGEKTKAKISDEVKSKTNCHFYITSRFGSDSFDIYPDVAWGNVSCGIDYGGEDNKRILVNNKIQPVTFEELVVYGIDREYVSNIPQRVEAIKVAYKDAVTKQEELQAACNCFNSLAVGMNHIYPYDHLYKNIEP